MAKQTTSMRNYVPWMIAGGVVLILVIWFVASYNGLVTTKESVDKSWADVQAQYQRRADLIPNIVEVAKKSTAFQQETFTQIAELRSQWQQAASSGNREQQAAIGEEMGSALGRLIVVVENYPNLDLETLNNIQAQLEGTENRVAVARERFNDAVRGYNLKTKRFPSNIVAGMFNFEEEQFFEANEGTENAPVVDFT